MIVIIDISIGQTFNFKTRKDAARFMRVSLPTLRGWLVKPFFLYKTLIITSTGNGKIEKSNRALLEQIKIEDLRRSKEIAGKAHVQGILYKDRNSGNTISRSSKAANVVQN